MPLEIVSIDQAEIRKLYASVLAAVLELAGEKAEAVPVPAEPPMDESWAEPEVFGGCSTEGQAQPIRIVKNASMMGAQP